MAIVAAQRPSVPRVQAWLATNWPVVAWLVAAVVVNVVGAKMAPEVYRQSVELTDIPEADRAEMRRALADFHLSPAFLAWYEIVVFGVVGTLVMTAIGWLLIRRAPRTGFACYLAFVLLALTNANYPPSIDELLPGQPVAQTIVRLATIVAISGFFTLPFVFPDGRFVPRWTVVWGVYNVVAVAAFAFFPSFQLGGRYAGAVDAVLTVLLVGSALGSMIYRYRKVSRPDQRRQTKWVLFGLLIAFPAFFLGDALMRNIDATPAGVASLLGFLVVMPIAFTLPSVTLGIAILHHRLFDIDVVLNRTLVWLIMTIAVTGAYVGLVVGVGDLIGSRRSLLLALVATGLVAVAFQPLRDRVQRGVNRLLYGDRDDPYAVLSRLGQRLEATLAPEEILPAIVRTLTETLRLPYAAIVLPSGAAPFLAAAAGTPVDGTVRVPLTYQAEPVGDLVVAPRSPGEAFGPADRRLLEDLARQIGVAAHAVRLTGDLQRSRERIVSAREEERRRLRRDLHDGLGAQLAALSIQAGALRAAIRRDPTLAEEQAGELRAELRSAVGDIRRLVHGLRPPALDELGLVGALRERATQYGAGGVYQTVDGEQAGDPALAVTVVADELPALPAAVEVAAYRIVEEALANVAKHAAARTCLVRLAAADGLTLTVEDDGIGIGPDRVAGVGLLSMRERAQELGGTFTVERRADGPGTRLVVRLPLAEPARG
jgi:signal transduction histidine kinase